MQSVTVEVRNKRKPEISRRQFITQRKILAKLKEVSRPKGPSRYILGRIFSQSFNPPIEIFNLSISW